MIQHVIVAALVFAAPIAAGGLTTKQDAIASSNSVQTATPTVFGTSPATTTPATSVTATAQASETATPTATPRAAVFVVIVKADRLNLPVQDRTRPGVRDMATFMGGLTAFADGTPCDSLDFSSRPANSPTDGVLQIGLPNQPSACSRSGALITFRQSLGNAQLITTFTLRRGETVVLDNFGIEPPRTGDASSGMAPPSTGDGSLYGPPEKDTGWLNDSRVAVGVMAGIIAVIGGLFLAGVRRRPT